MSKKLIICILKTQYQWVGIESTREIVNKTAAILRPITQEGCAKYSDTFSSGAHDFEALAFLVMTGTSDNELRQLVEGACGKYYEVSIWS